MDGEPAAIWDRAIVSRILAGDTDAYDELVSRHRHQVFRIVARHVPPDQVGEVAHHAFVQAFLSLRSWSPIAPFEHWLARIAVRAGCDYWRQTYRDRDRGRVDDPSDWPRPEPAAPPDERIVDRDLLHWALDQLAIDDRLALTLLHLDEQSVADAAAILEWSEARVKVRAHRARKRLRDILERAGYRESRTP